MHNERTDMIKTKTSHSQTPYDYIDDTLLLITPEELDHFVKDPIHKSNPLFIFPSQRKVIEEHVYGKGPTNSRRNHCLFTDRPNSELIIRNIADLIINS